MPPLGVPTPGDIRAQREAAGLKQSQAAALVYLGSGARWSEYENGVHAMDAARWELFVIKCGNHPDYRPAKGVNVPGA